MRVIPARNAIMVAAKATVPFISIVMTFELLPLWAWISTSVDAVFSIRTYFAIINQSAIAAGSIATNVACQPKFWIMAAPPTKPTTAPPENVELNIVWPIASFFSGRISLMIPKAIGNIAIPMPCAVLAAIMYAESNQDDVLYDILNL